MGSLKKEGIKTTN